MPDNNLQFIAVRDTREKKGYWNFVPDECCGGMIDKSLKTGDYSLLGGEDILYLERKRNCGEIALNFGQKWKQFSALIERGQSYKYRFIICEFGWEHLRKFPQDSGIPPKYWKKLKITGNLLLSRILDFQLFNDVHVILAGDTRSAAQLAYNILLKVHRKLLKESTEYVEKLVAYRTRD